MSGETLFALFVFFAACWAVIGWAESAYKWAARRWKERREARKPRIQSISEWAAAYSAENPYGPDLDGELENLAQPRKYGFWRKRYMDPSVDIRPVDWRISEYRCEGSPVSADEFYRRIEARQTAPEPPDEWETENQAAMIEAVRRAKP